MYNSENAKERLNGIFFSLRGKVTSLPGTILYYYYQWFELILNIKGSGCKVPVFNLMISDLIAFCFNYTE